MARANVGRTVAALVGSICLGVATGIDANPLRMGLVAGGLYLLVLVVAGDEDGIL